MGSQMGVASWIASVVAKHLGDCAAALQYVPQYRRCPQKLVVPVYIQRLMKLYSLKVRTCHLHEILVPALPPKAFRFANPDSKRENRDIFDRSRYSTDSPPGD